MFQNSTRKRGIKMKTIIKNRIQQFRELFEENGAAGILLSKEENISYLTMGARNHITFNTTEGVASVLITDEKAFFITNNIEKERLFNEEIHPDLHHFFTPVVYNWWENEYDVVQKLVRIDHLISDSGRYLTRDITLQIAPKRFIMSEFEKETLREVGTVIDDVFFNTMDELHPAMTEIEVQGLFSNEFLKQNYEPILVLVFSDKSSMLYRHNLPRPVRLGERCFVSVCIRYKGLILSSTRSILFKENDKIRDQHNKNCYVDATVIAQSRPGKKVSEAFKALQEAYSEKGFEGEWQHHHQGGLAGYKSRELVAKPNANYVFQKGNCLAWNPTICGTKSEDTAVLNEMGNEIVSFPERSQWPALIYEIDGMTIRRPDIVLLER